MVQPRTTFTLLYFSTVFSQVAPSRKLPTLTPPYSLLFPFTTSLLLHLSHITVTATIMPCHYFSTYPLLYNQQTSPFLYFSTSLQHAGTLARILLYFYTSLLRHFLVFAHLALFDRLRQLFYFSTFPTKPVIFLYFSTFTLFSFSTLHFLYFYTSLNFSFYTSTLFYFSTTFVLSAG